MILGREKRKTPDGVFPFHSKAKEWNIFKINIVIDDVRHGEFTTQRES